MLQAHERVGDFEVIRLLGKGGMGEVYEALQFNPERRVALKVLAPWLAGDDHALQRFWREAQVPANLDHPGIVRIISTGKTPGGVAYYTMYLVRGVSLAEMIRRANAASASTSPTQPVASKLTPSAARPQGAPPSPNPAEDFVPPWLYDYCHDRFLTVARVGTQAARALAYAHEQGHLHRDIKPSNLMIDVHNQVYLVDFGLTRALQPSDDGTQSGAVVGTPWYMSPEQSVGKALDERSDIYSLGVALFELATQGLGPFTANRDNKDAVLAQVRAGQVLPLRTLAPGIPWALEQIILRAMQYKPKRRYASAAELTGELEAFLGSSNKPSQEATRKRAGPNGRRRRGYLVAVAVLLTGALAVAAFAFRARQAGPGAGADVVDTAVPAGRKLDGTRALPESLRTTEKDIAVPLFNNEPRPIWSEAVLGSGKIRPAGKQLELPCWPPDAVNSLAVADPDCSWFELSVELMQMKGFNNGLDHELGVFFGQSRDSAKPSRCFLIQVDERPVGEDRHGRLTLGTALLDKGSEKRAETLEWPTAPRASDVIPLTEATKGRWHVVKVKVLDQTFFVSVDDQPPREYKLHEFRNPNGGQPLTTAGAVGLWTRRGIGLFRRATLTRLPSENSQ
jgi:serine/threonine protein kinase